MTVAELKSLNLCFLPVGDYTVASSRLRCYAFRNALTKAGFAVQSGFGEDCDILYVQKKSDDIALKSAYLCKSRGGTLIFDIDDFPASQVFRKNAQLLISIADAVTTATPEQQSLVQSIFGAGGKGKFFCLPNPIDYELDAPLSKRHVFTSPLKIVWFGNIENFPGHLVDAINTLGNAEFNAITNVSDEISRRYPSCHFHEWSYEGFSTLLSGFDVCLLSHQGNEILNAKNSNKMATAIVHGLPTVASRTPDYERLAVLIKKEDFLFDDENSLLDCLKQLRSPTKRNAYINSSQELVWDLFNIDSILPIFVDVCLQAVQRQSSAVNQSISWRPHTNKMVLRQGLSRLKSFFGLS